MSPATSHQLPASSDRLYATVVTLRAAHDGTVPATQGHHAHAAFLALVHQVDAGLAAALHGGSVQCPVNIVGKRALGSDRKPFTVGPLDGLPPARDGRIAVRAGQSATLRFTFLGSGLFNVFIRRFLEGDARPTIRLGPVEWLVEQVLTTPGSHPWAGYTSWAELWGRWQDAPVPRTITLEFASPTGFNRTSARVKRLTDPYPSPRSVFGGLARAWRTLGPLELPDDLEAYADETVGVARYRLETHIHQYAPGRRQVGATGVVTYELLDPADEAHARALHILADFAFYAGVGYKTTQGMGQCRRAERAE